MYSRKQRGVVFVAAALLSLVVSAPARADTVTDWNTTVFTALTAPVTAGGAGQSPPVSTIHLAMVHGAVYDAVNAIDRRYQPYLISPKAKRWYSKDAAAATAAYRVISAILPAQQMKFDMAYATSLAGISAGKARDGGIAVGEAAAKAMLDARMNDGRFGAFRFTPGTAPGQWRPVPPAFVNDPNAWVKDVTPFMIESASDYRTDGPNRLTSRKYAKEFNEVKSLGSAGSKTRDADQTDMSLFWAEGPAIWTRIAHQLSDRYGLTIADNARFFAMLYLTGADALIACWDDKAAWSFWRPITAIQEAGTDGNPATEPDSKWMPLINNPPYPDHPSGLACVISAMARTSRDFFGTNRVEFSATGVISMTTRSFSRFTDAPDEVIDARVYSGLHFRTADEDGAEIGKEVARWRKEHFFQRSDRHDDGHGNDDGHHHDHDDGDDHDDDDD
jgi:hypothetical protein